MSPAMTMKMPMSKFRTCVLIAGLLLFAGALLSPAIVFKPDARSNPKRSACAFAVKDNVMCESFSFGGPGMTSCGVADGKTAGKTYVDKAKILDYCKGWDTSFADVYFGYRVLLMGYLGVFVGVFAWFANPLMLLAVLLSMRKRSLASMLLSVGATALALQSTMLEGVPFTESSMDPENLNVVDRLGIGFYLWIGALAAFAAYCFLRTGDDAVRS